VECGGDDSLSDAENGTLSDADALALAAAAAAHGALLELTVRRAGGAPLALSYTALIVLVGAAVANSLRRLTLHRCDVSDGERASALARVRGAGSDTELCFDDT
jgi:hypothetical protein